MRVLLPSLLIVSLARQDLEEVDVTNRSFAWTRPANMPINEPSEKFLMVKDPIMDRSNLWPLVKFDMNKWRDIFGGIFKRGTKSRYDIDAPTTLHYELSHLLADRRTQPSEYFDGRIRLVIPTPEMVWLLELVRKEKSWTAWRV